MYTDLCLSHCTRCYLTSLELGSILSSDSRNSSVWLFTEDRAEIFLNTSAFIFVSAVIPILDLLVCKYMQEENPLLVSLNLYHGGYFASVSTVFHAWFLIYIQFFLALSPFSSLPSLLGCFPLLLSFCRSREFHAAPCLLHQKAIIKQDFSLL